MKKKILAVVLAALMIISILPVTVFAADAKCPGKGNVHTLDNCTSEVESVVAGTCDEHDHHDGFTLYECTVCGDHFVDNFVEVEHEWVEKKKETPATCLKDGTTATYECKVCKATKGGETIPALGHDFEIIESTGDCEHEGKIVTKCKNCGSTNTQLVKGDGHAWSEHPTSIKKEPTHTTTGIAVYTCQNEGCTETKEVIIMATEKHEHVVHHKAVEASCKTPGTAEYWECTDCGKLFTEEKCENETTLKKLAVTKDGHDKKLIHHETVAATCTSTGIKEYWECEVCGKKYLDESGTTLIKDFAKETTIAKLAHAYEFDKTIAPTCTEKGFDQYKCSVCGDIDQKNAVDALEHTDWDDATNTNKNEDDATCTLAGVRHWKCGRCGEDRIEKTDDVRGHTEYDDESSKDKKVIKEATCTEDGERTWKCGRCDAEMSEVIEALGHTGFGSDKSKESSVPSKKATCTEAGLNTWKCGRCDAELSKTIKALGHTAYDDLTSKDAAIKDATCTEDGEKTWKCGGCDAEMKTIIKATGHDFKQTEYTAPTCINKSGLRKFACSNCDATYEEKVPFDPTKTYDSLADAKVDHCNLVADNLIEKKAATCSANGYEKYKCPDCLSVVTITLKKDTALHSYVKVDAVAPTCVKAGTDEYDKCEYCGYAKYKSLDYNEKGIQVKDKKTKLADVIKLPATGHNMFLDISRDVTCEEFGYKHWVCGNEGCTYEHITDYVRATGHVWTKDTINSTAATCTEGGLTVEYCTNGCGGKKFTELEALGHKNKAGDKLEDSCTNTAKDRKCVNGCGATIGQAHHDEVEITVAATCKNYKYDLRMCYYCHTANILKVYETEGYGDHNYGEWIVTTRPTADKEGEEARTCQICGEEQTRKIATTAAIDASFEIVNAAKEGADFTDSALVAVKLVLNTTSTDIWGISFAVKYDSKVVKFEKCEMLSKKLDTNANAHDDEKGTVRIIAQASNGDDKEKQNVTLEGKEEFAILYFRINSAAATETAFSFGTIEAMTFEEKVLRVDGTSAKIEIKQFLDANGDGDVNMHDLLLVYKMTIGEVGAIYDAVVDVNKDGVINYVDLLALYEYYLGAKDYKAMTALRP